MNRRVFLMDKNLIAPTNYQKWEVLAGREGVELHAVCPDRWVENYRLLTFPEGFSKRFASRALPVVWPGYENRGFYTKGLKEAFLEADPDVLVCFEEPSSLFAMQALHLVKRWKPSCRLIYFSWYNRYPDRFYAYRPQTFYRAILALTLRAADRVLCANEGGLEYYRRRVGARAEKLSFSIDLDRFRPAAADDVDHPVGEADAAGSSKTFTIGYIGRLLRMKGVDTLINAFAMADAERHPDWRLSILGGGEEKDSLRSQMDQLGLAGRAQMIETVPSDKVISHLRGLDVLVLPSRSSRFWLEQFGRVLAEAMSAGVVVVGSDSGAIPEVIGDAGLIFPEDDAAALLDRLQTLHADPSLRRSLRDKGMERARLFSPDRFADTLLAVIDEVLTPDGARR